MAASAQQNGNADAASTAAEQGSAYRMAIEDDGLKDRECGTSPALFKPSSTRSLPFMILTRSLRFWVRLTTMIASGNPHVPNTAEQNSVEIYERRLGLFLVDTDLQGSSSDHAGTVEHHSARTQRVFGAITAVNQLLPSGGGSGTSDGQADDKPPMDLQSTGAQFDE
ncbi:hypothetical protein CSUB01_02195 [Colletotrichum sublineola]|uniref:Uncharacterized protein n=1 Tax=Colletotrichum sublineola TaxID=1173701 RepID=A0A066X8D6_COLSU|nr:hypothetical protein CSUB01_02195 [Colletotrichum sublineola]